MYFSRCYLIENTSEANTTLSITASTYRCIPRLFYLNRSLLLRERNNHVLAVYPHPYQLEVPH